MIPYPSFLTPEIFSVGPIRVRWYGLMYVLGFAVGREILRRMSRRNRLEIAGEQIDDFLIALFIGMLIGARALYMLVYYRAEPGEPMHWYTPIAVWEGGLSFHGALLGMIGAIGWFSAYHKIRPLQLLDGLGLAAPPGLFFGRLGNFANAELYGRVTDSFIGMSFPVWGMNGKLLGYTEPRHPSQLYEAVTEGLLSIVVTHIAARYAKREGVVFAIGICWYSIARFGCEFFREKDAQLSYYFGWMTMGQILTLAMATGALGLAVYASKHGHPVNSAPAPAPASPEASAAE